MRLGKSDRMSPDGGAELALARSPSLRWSVRCAVVPFPELPGVVSSYPHLLLRVAAALLRLAAFPHLLVGAGNCEVRVCLARQLPRVRPIGGFRGQLASLVW